MLCPTFDERPCLHVGRADWYSFGPEREIRAMIDRFARRMMGLAMVAGLVSVWGSGADAASLNRPQRTTERPVIAFPRLRRATKLNPRVAKAIVVLAAEQEIPLHPLGRILIGLDSLRNDFAIEQKRELERKDTRLSSPIIST